jgi:hypothetical protein
LFTKSCVLGKILPMSTTAQSAAVVRLNHAYRGMTFRTKISEMAGKLFVMELSGDVFRIQEQRRTGLGSGFPDEALYEVGAKVGRGYSCLPTA